ncbi:unknown protein [Seminavis robusta]|uniref:DDE Tnp4 domain-containing protein n=1 Tax=Seminavis robusta TaxID=568900 RepID=A0A9N8ERS9_9STRA|nr:unknown protein [Seminavis robusta]|eukprot:Sro1697_g291900.1 n/a (312) ;mRNA; f:12396-13331
MAEDAKEAETAEEIAALTADDFFALAFRIFGNQRWEKRKRETNENDFKDAFGVIPETCVKIWEALRTHQNPAFRLQSKRNDKPVGLLFILRFLWRYPTALDLGRFFKVKSENTVKKYIDIWLPRIHSLLKPKLGSFADHQDGLIFVFTVDGTHCRIEEPRPFSTDWSSHKFGGKAAVNYELAICIHKPQLAWVYGPTKPGKYNDVSVFRLKLKEKMEAELPGCRIIGDKGYKGEPDLISLRNEFDPEEIAEFKDRASARHESFNQKLKCFKILSVPFRHGVANHKMAFEAVCVVVMFQIECGGASLFDAYL